jgi:hypothetical protein
MPPLTVRQVKERYSVTVRTVLAWIALGQLRAIDVSRQPGSKKPRWRVTQEALDRFEELRGTTRPPPRRRRKRFTTMDFIK